MTILLYVNVFEKNAAQTLHLSMHVFA